MFSCDLFSATRLHIKLKVTVLLILCPQYPRDRDSLRFTSVSTGWPKKT